MGRPHFFRKTDRQTDGKFSTADPEPQTEFGGGERCSTEGSELGEERKKNNKNNVFNSVMTFGENESLDDWYKSKEETVREIHCVMIGQRVLIWGEGRF